MHKLIGSIVALGYVLAGKLQVALGMRRAPDGWRRTVGILLRGEGTHFAVSAFGLRVPPEGLIEGLHAFLSTQPDAHFELEWTPDETVRRRIDRVAAVNASIEHVDHGDPAQRFRPPQFYRLQTPRTGFLTFVLRPNAAGTVADVWVSAHHVGLDGVPLQDLMSNLERAWGIAETVTYPAPDERGAFLPPRRCSPEGERAIEEVLDFVDLTPVHALRPTLNAKYASEMKEPATVGAVLAWLIALEPEFSGVKIASTVDVRASRGYDRDVDVVPLRPADYAREGDEWAGFPAFANEFNRLIALSRERESPLRKSLQTAALLPAGIHLAAVRSDPAALDETFGSMCITIIRDAKVFVAPMTDLGLGHGFFAIGNMQLPAAGGRRVTAVSVKGDAGTVARHHEILRRAIERAGNSSRVAGVS